MQALAKSGLLCRRLAASGGLGRYLGRVADRRGMGRYEQTAAPTRLVELRRHERIDDTFAARRIST